MRRKERLGGRSHIRLLWGELWDNRIGSLARSFLSPTSTKVCGQGAPARPPAKPGDEADPSGLAHGRRAVERASHGMVEDGVSAMACRRVGRRPCSWRFCTSHRVCQGRRPCCLNAAKFPSRSSGSPIALDQVLLSSVAGEAVKRTMLFPCRRQSKAMKKNDALVSCNVGRGRYRELAGFGNGSIPALVVPTVESELH
jgi:hypothetical protein